MAERRRRPGDPVDPIGPLVDAVLFGGPALLWMAAEAWATVRSHVNAARAWVLLTELRRRRG